MTAKKLVYLILFLAPSYGYSQPFPVTLKYYDFVPYHINNYFGEVDSSLLENNIRSTTYFYRSRESDSLRLFRRQHFENGKRVKEEQFELLTGQLERLTFYSYHIGKLEVEIMHYPSVENGYRLPARHFRYLLNADYVFLYQPDSLGRIRVNLSYKWQKNGDIRYETFDYKDSCIANVTMTLKDNAFDLLHLPKPSYPRTEKRGADNYIFELYQYNGLGKLLLYTNCDRGSAFGHVDQFDYNDKGLMIREQHFIEKSTGRELSLEYIVVHE